MAGVVVGSSAKKEAGANVDAAAPAIRIENCRRFMRDGSAQHSRADYRYVHRMSLVPQLMSVLSIRDPGEYRLSGYEC